MEPSTFPAAAIEPGLRCVRCDESFENIALLRHHFRVAHMATGGATAGKRVEEDGDSSASDAEADDARESDEEDYGIIATSDRIFRDGARTLVQVATTSAAPASSALHAWAYTALLRTSGNAELAVACDDITTPDEPLRCSPGDLWRSGDTFAVLMLRSGYFSAAVFEMRKGATAAATKGSNAAGVGSVGLESSLNLLPCLLHHRRFSHYTTRRKQGGSQSAYDNKGKAAQSVGAQLRRAGEAHLQADIDSLMADRELWMPALHRCRRVFYSIPKRSLTQVFPALMPTTEGPAAAASSPTEPVPLARNDPRLHRVPFMTARPSLSECTRVADTLCCLRYADPGEIREAARMKREEREAQAIEKRQAKEQGLTAVDEEDEGEEAVAPLLSRPGAASASQGRTLGFAAAAAAFRSDSGDTGDRQGQQDYHNSGGNSEDDDEAAEDGTAAAPATVHTSSNKGNGKKKAAGKAGKKQSKAAFGTAPGDDNDDNDDLDALEAAASEAKAEKSALLALSHEAQALRLQLKEAEDLAAVVAVRLKLGPSSRGSGSSGAVPYSALRRGLGLQSVATALDEATTAATALSSGGSGAASGGSKGKKGAKTKAKAGAGPAASSASSIAASLALCSRAIASASEKLNTLRSLLASPGMTASELLGVCGLDDLAAAAVVAEASGGHGGVDWESIPGPALVAFKETVATAPKSGASAGNGGSSKSAPAPAPAPAPTASTSLLGSVLSFAASFLPSSSSSASSATATASTTAPAPAPAPAPALLAAAAPALVPPPNPASPRDLMRSAALARMSAAAAASASASATADSKGGDAPGSQ